MKSLNQFITEAKKKSGKTTWRKFMTAYNGGERPGKDDFEDWANNDGFFKGDSEDAMTADELQELFTFDHPVIFDVDDIGNVYGYVLKETDGTEYSVDTVELLDL